MNGESYMKTKSRNILKYAGALHDSKVLNDLQILTKKMRKSGRVRM